MRLRAFLLAILISLLAAEAKALDMDLWNLPRPKDSSVVWENKPVGVIDIKAAATHLRSNLAAAEVTAFYEKMLPKQGWQAQPRLTDIISTFSKQGKFLYLGVQGHPQGIATDIFLVASAQSLSICPVLEQYFLKDNIQPDTPGRDITDVPRYPGSRRRFDAFAPESGAVLIYETDDKPAMVAQFYRKILKDAGWQERRMLSLKLMQKLRAELRDTETMFFYSANDRQLVINVTPVPEKYPCQEKAKNRSLIIVTRNVLDEIGGSLDKEAS